MMIHPERSMVSTPGQASSKALLKRWVSAWKKSPKARLVPHHDWHLESARVTSPTSGVIFDTSFNMSTDSHSESCFGKTPVSLSRLATEGASLQLPSSFMSPKITEMDNGTNNYCTFHHKSQDTTNLTETFASPLQTLWSILWGSLESTYNATISICT